MGPFSRRTLKKFYSFSISAAALAFSTCGPSGWWASFCLFGFRNSGGQTQSNVCGWRGQRESIWQVTDWYRQQLTGWGANAGPRAQPSPHLISCTLWPRFLTLCSGRRMVWELVLMFRPFHVWYQKFIEMCWGARCWISFDNFRQQIYKLSNSLSGQWCPDISSGWYVMHDWLVKNQYLVLLTGQVGNRHLQQSSHTVVMRLPHAYCKLSLIISNLSPGIELAVAYILNLALVHCRVDRTQSTRRQPRWLALDLEEGYQSPINPQETYDYLFLCVLANLQLALLLSKNTLVLGVSGVFLLWPQFIHTNIIGRWVHAVSPVDFTGCWEL